MSEIGVAIRNARKQQALTQARLALRLGMSRATLSGIETGKITDIGIRKLMALCASLGLELSVGPRRPYPTLQQLRDEAREQRR